jgi:SAM-dependent methyltransferase
MRSCPVCESFLRSEAFRMDYHVPDYWPLPHQITWYDCLECGMIYGDGDFTQSTLDAYYRQYYGYGVNGPDNIQRLNNDAERLMGMLDKSARVLDFGGAGDDGRSILVDRLTAAGYLNAFAKGPGESLGRDFDLIYASHVLEHVYDLPDIMNRLSGALKQDGTLIVDIPEAMGILREWRKAILDYNTKHINHFTVRTMLELAHRWNFELIDHHGYKLDGAPCFQFVFKHIDLLGEARKHIEGAAALTLAKLATYTEPVNVWGLNDRLWYIIDQAGLNVLDFCDNDPAYRGKTFMGKPVLEKPTNDAPILIICQGQGGRLIANILKMGLKNRVIEI